MKNVDPPTDTTRSTLADGAPKLVFLNGEHRGKVFPLGGETTRIGRSDDNEISIDLGLTVSSLHAVISQDSDDGSWWIEDRGSKNGTFVNDETVKRSPLKEGDSIRFAAKGPEARFTAGDYRLPGVVESTVTTFLRTRSVKRCLNDLLSVYNSNRRPGGSNVDVLVADRLEKISRRTHWFAVSTIIGVIFVATIVVLTVFFHFRSVGGGGLGRGSGVAVRMILPKLDPIYSSLFFSSREHPIGSVKVVNREDHALEDLELSFEFAKEAAGYLVEPYLVDLLVLEPGATRDVPLKPRISDKIRAPRTYEITAVIRLRQDGEVIKELVRGVYVHGYNVFNWEDPKRITTFIDPQDRAVQSFVTEVMRSSPEGALEDFPPRPFRVAISLVTGLIQLKMRYVPDAVTPASQRIDADAKDRVNNPWETLLRRMGDCDDLTVLCATVFEAAGIRSAVAVGPAHVLVLFDSGITPAILDSTPLEKKSVVVWKDRVWVPIETTRIGSFGASFMTVWSAAWQRREEISSGEMELIAVREGWKTYAPPPVQAELADEDLRRIRQTIWTTSSLTKEIDDAVNALKRLFHENLEKKIKTIEEAYAEGAERDHEIGLLYAQSGLFAEARHRFRTAIFGAASIDDKPLDEELKAIPKRDDVPFLLFDLGIAFTLGAKSPKDLGMAVRCYQEGLNRLPEEVTPLRAEYLLHLALVHRLRGDLAQAKESSETAFATVPTLRERYDLMVRGTGGKAGEMEVRGYLRTGFR